MVMAYLIQRNDDYIEKMEHFDKRLDELTQIMKVVQYNIEDLQHTVKSLRITDSQDAQLKEDFNAKRQAEISRTAGG